MKLILATFLLVLIFSACSPMLLSKLNSKTMSQIQLGMTKQELSEILGNKYTISEKRMESNSEVEVLSYRNYPYTDEFYQFVFINGNLKEWYKEVIPSCEFIED
jgi:hypothetical protein